MHLPSISQRDRPTSATVGTNNNPPYSPTSTSPSTSPRSSSDPSQQRLLNPLKFAKGERKGDKDDGELELWYMTPPGEYRYWMYQQDGTQIKLMQQRLQQTFNRRGRRPHTPIEPPSASFPQPTSESVRARLNLLKWLASPNCLLFYDCDEVVSVDDLQLDTLLIAAHSTTDGGAKAIQLLMRWSKEGRRYTDWDEVQTEVERLMAAPSGAAEESKEKEAMRRLAEEERLRKDKLSQRMERERQERFAALKRRQDEERSVRQQRKAEKDEQRRRVVRRRENKKLAALDHNRATSTASTLSAISRADSTKASKTAEKGRKGDKKQPAAAEEEEEEEEEESQQAEQREQEAKETEEGEPDTNDAYDDVEYAAEGESAQDTNGLSSQPSSGAESGRSTQADKEAQEEKQASGTLTVDTPASDDEDEGSIQPIVSTTSSARPSSRPALLTPSPRAAPKEADEVVTEREKRSARGDNSARRPATGSARETESDVLIDTPL